MTSGARYSGVPQSVYVSPDEKSTGVPHPSPLLAPDSYFPLPLLLVLPEPRDEVEEEELFDNSSSTFCAPPNNRSFEASERDLSLLFPNLFANPKSTNLI